MRWSALCLTSLLLVLVGLSSRPSQAQSTTNVTMSARSRALRDIEISQASRLEAIPASVDESLDRRIEADVQEIFADPSLLGWEAGAPDTTAGNSSSPLEDDPVMSRAKMPAATSWSPLQIVVPAPEAESALPDVSDHPAVELPLLSTLGAIAETGNRPLPDSGATPQPKAGLSSIQAQKHDREKRQARELLKKSYRQCGQLHSGELECRLKLNRSGPVSNRPARQVGESVITTR